MIFVPDIIGDVIDSIRESGDYTFVSTAGDTFTVYSKGHNIKSGEWIKIDEIDYLVSGIDGYNITLDISGKDAPPNGGSFKALAPYYLYGTRMDINNRLLMKNSDDVFQYQKYPLIALRMPVAEEVQQDLGSSANFNIAIMTLTDKNYLSEERYENVIKPILAPIYDKFIDNLKRNKYIRNIGRPKHTKITRLFWGVENSEGYKEYIFSDPLDAIEIVDLKLNFINSKC